MKYIFRFIGFLWFLIIYPVVYIGMWIIASFIYSLWSFKIASPCPFKEIKEECFGPIEIFQDHGFYYDFDDHGDQINCQWIEKNKVFKNPWQYLLNNYELIETPIEVKEA